LLLLTLILFVVVVFALIFAVPLFVNLFGGLGVELPISAKWLGILPAWLLVALAILVPLFLFVVLLLVLWKLVRRPAGQ